MQGDRGPILNRTFLWFTLCTSEIAYHAYLGTSGLGSLLTSDQVRQNGYAEATRDNDNLGSINLPQGIMSNQVGENNCTEFSRDNGHMQNINFNLLEGCVDTDLLKIKHPVN